MSSLPQLLYDSAVPTVPVQVARLYLVVSD